MKAMLDRFHDSFEHHTGKADWLSLHLTTPLLCFVRRFGRSMEARDQQAQSRRLERKKQICALLFARAVHLCDHDMCYRGCILHLHHVSSRVDLHVILMLERQFICFSPISLRPSALAIIFSCALGLRNPSAFSCAACCSHAYMHPYIYITSAFYTQVLSAFSLAL